MPHNSHPNFCGAVLRELIEGLSDEEAEAWLARMGQARTTRLAGTRPPPGSLRELLMAGPAAVDAAFRARPPVVDHEDIDDWDPVDAAELAELD